MTPRHRSGDWPGTCQTNKDEPTVDGWTKIGEEQLSSVLFDLVAKDNDQARRITAQARCKQIIQESNE